MHPQHLHVRQFWCSTVLLGVITDAPLEHINQAAGVYLTQVTFVDGVSIETLPMHGMMCQYVAYTWVKSLWLINEVTSQSVIRVMLKMLDLLWRDVSGW